MTFIWLVQVIEECDSYFSERGTAHKEIHGAFAREEDAIGYGLWLHCNDKVDGRQVQIARIPLAPPGSMEPPEEEEVRV